MNPIEKLKALEVASTPGPWTPTAAGSLIEAEGEHFPVAKVYGYGRFNRAHSQVKANGHMISALRNLAPEILAVLEAVGELVGNHDNTSPGYSEIPNEVLGMMLGALHSFNYKAQEVLK